MAVSVEKLKTIFGGEIVKNTDNDIDFSKAIKGKYIAEVKEFGLKHVKTQNGDKDIVEIKMKIIEDLEGSDPSFNRFVNKTYWLEDGEYSTLLEAINRLGNDLYTMGVFDDITLDIAAITKDNINLITDLDIKGRKVKLSLYKTKTGSQAVKIVVLEEPTMDFSN